MQSTWHIEVDVAIIMDGNGRWALERGLPRSFGHRAGVTALRKVVDRAQMLNIRSLTVYAFSSDNWKRPAAEVVTLFGLLRQFLQDEVASLAEKNFRLTVIGRRDRLPAGIAALIQQAETATQFATGLHLRVALDYSGRESIARAANSCGNTSISQASLSQAMSSANGLEKIDFLIRTGGEQRLSDFLLWESAYAELYFSERLWPNFDGDALSEAMDAFHRRNRRYGALPEPASLNSSTSTVKRTAQLPD